MTPSPPSEHHTCPEVYEHSSEARVTYSGAISTGCPGRPRGVLAKMFHFFLWLPTAGLKHGPVRSRRYRVHADPLRSQLFRQRFGEHRETGFGLRIVKQYGARFNRLNGGGVNDGSGAFMWRNAVFVIQKGA